MIHKALYTDTLQKAGRTRGWLHVSYLLASRFRQRVSLLVCFYKIIFKERVNSFNKNQVLLEVLYIYFVVVHCTVSIVKVLFWMAKKARFVTI